MVASVCWAELMGPWRFGGWHPDDSPKGVPAKKPWVQIFATSATQSTNTMSALLGLLTDETIAQYAVDLGQEKCHARRCRTAGGAGWRRDVALGHWQPRPEARGHDPRQRRQGLRPVYEIANVPVVGEDSVAENTLYDFQKQRDGKSRSTGLTRPSGSGGRPTGSTSGSTRSTGTRSRPATAT